MCTNPFYFCDWAGRWNDRTFVHNTLKFTFCGLALHFSNTSFSQITNISCVWFCFGFQRSADVYGFNNYSKNVYYFHNGPCLCPVRGAIIYICTPFSAESRLKVRTWPNLQTRYSKSELPNAWRPDSKCSMLSSTTDANSKNLKNNLSTIFLFSRLNVFVQMLTTTSLTINGFQLK